MPNNEDKITKARAEFEQLEAQMTPHGSARGSLFGKPCLKIGTKSYACQFRDGVAFKLAPDPRAAALALSGAELFDPSGKGRPMKEWVQVPVKHAGKWAELAQQALDYAGR
ncbi:hypothetical protein OG943_21880 [Amycolatopsis sp. NBC_00345]|uniref:hypothetical protein n=1 Tax=Amycolatopsis sp. NBC_00345 TaxID=2975955 RepID=UPI002E25F28D